MAEVDRDPAALKTARPIEIISARDEALKLGTPRPVHDFKLASTPDDRYDLVYIGSASPGVDTITFVPPPSDPVELGPPIQKDTQPASRAALAASGDANALRTLAEIPSSPAALNTASASFSSGSSDIAAERHLTPGSLAVAGTAYGDPDSIASLSVDRAPQAVAAEQAEESEQRPPGGEDARPELPNQAPTSLQAALVPTAENAAAGTVVGELSTLDPDRRDSHSYEIVDGHPLFQIDGDLITLKPGAHLNFETQSSYELVIRSTDPAGNSIVKTVIVHVTDVDEFNVTMPVDTDAAANSVAENAANDTTVGIAAFASDADASSNGVSYSLTDDAGGRFAIDAATGVVTVADGSQLDYESAASHQITVQATSADGSTATQSFIVSLTDADEFDVSPISDSNAAANAVAENAANGTTVGIAAFASDADGSSNGVSYSLTDSAGRRFAINASTGVVTVADGGQVDYESAASHSIIVLATSADGSTSTQSFTVSLTDADEFNVTALVDTNAAANGVAENAANGATVGITAFASDADGSSNGVSYSLVTAGGAPVSGGPFAINAATGVVTVADGSQLNYEAATSQTLYVKATSADGSTSTQSFTVNLTDADEFDVSPISDSNTAANSVAENAANGTTVGIGAFASDADASNSTVSYSLVTAGGAPVSGGPFAIDAATGVVTVADSSQLNYEAAASHTLYVKAASADGSTSTQSFTVNLTDADEFDVSVVSDSNAAANAVAENAANGTTVGITAFASDADGSNNGVSYSLVTAGGAPVSGGPFAIDAATGVVTVADGGQVDYESAASQTLYVKATSADGSNSTQNFTVNLTDADEFDVGPVSDSNAASNAVAENAANGTTVGITAFASDADGSSNGVSYSLVTAGGAPVSGGPLAIDAATGVVTVADGSQLNYEAATSQTLYVKATSVDGSSSTQSFSIAVTDADEFDVSPISDSNAAANSVAENAANGTTVGISAFASDADGSNSTVSYSLVTAGGAPVSGGPFAIDAATGMVTVADGSQLNYEAATSHTLYVKATSVDGSSSTQSFNIAVTDADEFDVGSVSDSNAAANSVAENAANGTTVGITAFASDADGGNNGVSYSLVTAGGTPVSGGPFVIHGTTGVVTVADGSQLDYETATSQTLYVKATSADGSASTQSFSVNLSNAFDVAPTDMDFAGNDALSSSNILRLNNGATNQYAMASNFTDFPTHALTAEIRFTSSNLGTHDTPLLSYNASGSDNEFLLIGQPSTNKLGVYINGAAYTTGISLPTLFDGSQHMLSVSWNMQSGALKVYVDGVQKYSTTASAGVPISAGGTLVFGQEQDTLGGGFNSTQIFEGTIDEVRMFEYVRTAQEIASNAANRLANPSSDTGLVSNWQMNASGASVIDEAGSRNLTLYSGASLQGVLRAGTVVADVSSVTDADVGDGFTYSLPDNAGGKYAINASTGEISLVNSHNMSAVASHSVTVMATDAGGNGHSETLGIHLGTAGADTISGTANSDVMYGLSGDDSLNGGSGKDVLYGGSGNDALQGGVGNDTLYGGAGADALDGGGDIDTADYSTSGSGVTVDLAAGVGSSGDAAGDTLTGFENLTGSAYADDLRGDGGDNILIGGDGNDYLSGSAGNDHLYGGSGADTLIGGAGNDSIFSAGGADTLFGGDGNDLLHGEDGDDILDGGRSNDTLNGDDGSDLFTFSSNGGMDTMYGGIAGAWTDVIQLTGSDGVGSAGVFGTDWTLQLTSGSILSQDAHHITLSQDADGHIVFDSSNQITFTDMERVDF